MPLGKRTRSDTAGQFIKANPNKLSQSRMGEFLGKNRYKNDPPKNEFAAWPDLNSSPGPMISQPFRLLSGP